MLFVIYAMDVPSGVQLRWEHTAAHIAYLKEQPLKVNLAGPILGADGETAVGSMLIVEAPDEQSVRSFSENDPYTRAGLFQSVSIVPWRKTVGWRD